MEVILELNGFEVASDWLQSRVSLLSVIATGDSRYVPHKNLWAAIVQRGKKKKNSPAPSPLALHEDKRAKLGIGLLEL